jgi:hypothetical protein
MAQPVESSAPAAENVIGPEDFDPDLDSVYEVPEEPAEDKPEPKTGGKPPAAKKAKAEEKAEKPVEKPAEKPTPERSDPPAPKHSPALVRMALRLGATEQEIESVSEARLESWVESQVAAERAPKPAAKKDDDEEEALAEYEENGEKKKLLASHLDPGVAALIRGQKKDLAEMREAVAFLRQTEERRQSEAKWGAVEAAFGELDAATFGKGKLAKDAAEYRRREIVFAGAKLSDSDSPAEIRRKIKDTAAFIFGAAKPAPAADDSDDEPAAKPVPPKDERTGRFVKSKEAAAEEDAFLAGGLPLPATRGRIEPPDDKAAEKHVSSWFKSRGYSQNGAT